MFEISDDAMELIKSRLDSALEGRPDLRRGTSKVGLRLNFNHGSAYLSLAFPRSTDRVLCFMGKPLLIVDPVDLSRLQDTCLTVQQGPTGTVLSMVPRTANPPVQNQSL